MQARRKLKVIGRANGYQRYSIHYKGHLHTLAACRKSQLSNNAKCQLLVMKKGTYESESVMHAKTNAQTKFRMKF